MYARTVFIKLFCQTESHSNFKLAEKIPGKTTKIFCELAKELQIVLMISLFEKKTHGFYHNTSIVISEKGKILSKYRKMHIPDDPGYYEKFYFTPGDLGFKSVKTKFGKSYKDLSDNDLDIIIQYLELIKKEEG